MILKDKKIEITENNKTYEIELLTDKSQIVINGKTINLTGNFDIDYKAISNYQTAVLNPIQKIFMPEKAFAAVDWAGWAYLVAAIAGYNICERRGCEEPELAALFAPAYLAWVAIDVLILGDKANVAEINGISIRCPQNNNGKLEYLVRTANETQSQLHFTHDLI